MFDWIALDDFRLMTSNIAYHHECENMEHIVQYARSILAEWTNEQAEYVLFKFTDDCERYTSLLAEHTESLRNEHLNSPHDDNSWEETFFVNTDTIYYDWNTEHEAFDLSVLDQLGEEAIIKQVMNFDCDLVIGWHRGDEISKHSNGELYACLILGAISGYDFSLRYPDTTFWSKGLIPANDATQGMRLSGMEEALTSSVKVSFFVQNLFESKLDEIEKSNKKVKKSKVQIARTGGKARAKKLYAPLKSFVLEQFHKKKYDSESEAAHQIAALLPEFYSNNPNAHKLSPTRAPTTITDWIKKHLSSNSCPVCTERYGCLSKRKITKKESLTSALS